MTDDPTKTPPVADPAKPPVADPVDPPANPVPDGGPDLRQIVKEELAKLIPGGNAPPSQPSRRVDVEAQAEELVRKASEKFAVDQELSDLRKFKADAGKKVKEAVEATPVKLRRLTKALWGDK